ncbi:MAG: CheR family methyltransferase [Bacteroidota bacterium]
MTGTMQKMCDEDFEKLSHLIYNDYGIKMPYTKKTMLEGRLRRRLNENNISSYGEYCDFLFSKEGMDKELIHMIDVVSTNKTDFFREPAHFTFLKEEVLPAYKKDNKSHVNIWSAAASTGEEPYTIAITLEESMDKKRAFDYSIYCTDISTKVLQKGVTGIYENHRVTNIPFEIKKKYFLKNKDVNNPTVRIIPELRKKCTFDRLNLMDKLYHTPSDYDIIFCRNVLIYFDKPTQEQVINKICARLKPGGYLFLGHSESMTGIDAPVKTIKPTIYKKN